jgi:hypothetical protein
MMKEKIDELVERFTESWFEKKLNFFRRKREERERKNHNSR